MSLSPTNSETSFARRSRAGNSPPRKPSSKKQLRRFRRAEDPACAADEEFASADPIDYDAIAYWCGVKSRARMFLRSRRSANCSKVPGCDAQAVAEEREGRSGMPRYYFETQRTGGDHTEGGLSQLLLVNPPRRLDRYAHRTSWSVLAKKVATGHYRCGIYGPSAVFLGYYQPHGVAGSNCECPASNCAGRSSQDTASRGRFTPLMSSSSRSPFCSRTPAGSIMALLRRSETL